MSWIEWHQKSEMLASEAMVAYRANEFDRARALYAQAADSEQVALGELGKENQGQKVSRQLVQFHYGLRPATSKGGATGVLDVECWGSP